MQDLHNQDVDSQQRQQAHEKKHSTLTNLIRWQRKENALQKLKKMSLTMTRKRRRQDDLDSEEEKTYLIGSK